ncbi:MAG: hybrid sensor histidine kinase/response regulator [SAR324 cluster bacterium]|nr:hybrid sensor histidine kinase/response regulator [SAR324 cluster bacterium]
MDYDNLSMLELFQLECDELLPQLERLILTLENAGESRKSMFEIARIVHTLKGASLTVMAEEVNAFTHALEDYLGPLKNREVLTPKETDYILATMDWLRFLIGQTIAGKPVPEEVLQVIESISKGEPFPPIDGAPSPETPRDIPPEIPDFPEQTPVSSHNIEPVVVEQKSSVKISEEQNLFQDSSQSTQRIAVQTLNRLFNLSGELYVRSHGIAKLKDNMSGLFKSLSLLNQKSRLMPHLSPRTDNEESFQNLHNSMLEFQKLTADIQARFYSMYEYTDELNLQFQQLTETLREETMTARMVPLSLLFDTIPRMVREISQGLGKKVRFQINGDDTRIDKAMIERIKAPLEHLIRNALDHGIESPDMRKQRGKSAEGTLTLSAFQRGDEVHIELEDDGGGINLEKLREKIVSLNLLSAEKIQYLKTDELLDFIFLPGVTTRKEVSSLSGRGIGMDVVKFEIEKMHGKVITRSEPGQYTAFTLRLPLSLAITHTLLMEASGQLYAIPTSMVEQYFVIETGQIEQIGGKNVVTIDGKPHLVAWLSELMGNPLPEFMTNIRMPALMFRMDNTDVVVIADHFAGESEVVVKPLDPRLKKVQNLMGATLLNDGRIALVVDVIDFLHTIRESQYQALQNKMVQKPEQAVKKILIVEDSLTIREMERKMLQKAGYDVTLAVDGLDGMNKIRQQLFDLIISDIDMPRMNGLELTRSLKADEKYRQIPLVIVSYKDRAEDRKRGMEAGADHYIAKNQFDSGEFLQLIQRLIL